MLIIGEWWCSFQITSTSDSTRCNIIIRHSILAVNAVVYRVSTIGRLCGLSSTKKCLKVVILFERRLIFTLRANLRRRLRLHKVIEAGIANDTQIHYTCIIATRIWNNHDGDNFYCFWSFFRISIVNDSLIAIVSGWIPLSTALHKSITWCDDVGGNILSYAISNSICVSPKVNHSIHICIFWTE